MHKNLEFVNVITGLTGANTPERTKALDDLLKVDPGNVAAFRQAIIAHKEFWKTFPLLSTESDYVDTDAFIIPAGPPTLNDIQKAVAEKRVSLGLKDAEDEVIVKILSNNQDECRAYLASRPELGKLSTAHGWKPNEPTPAVQPPLPSPPPQNKYEDLLSNVAIAAFKKQALDIYLTRLINAKKINAAITSLTTELNTLQEHRKTLTKNSDSLKFLLDINPSHLYNPSFQGTAKTKAFEMKNTYQEMSDQCDLVIDQLRHQKIELESYLRNIPKNDTEIHGNILLDERNKIKTLRQNIEAELAEVTAKLIYYEEIQEKLSGKQGILQAISDAAEHKKTYLFNANGVTRRIISPEELAQLKFESQSPSKSGVDVSGQPNEVQEYLLKEDNIPEGKIAVFDVVQTIWKTPLDPDNNVSGVKEFEVVGRFTSDRSFPATVTSKGGEITKIPGGKFEILQFPKQLVPPPARGSEEDIRLINAKIEFSMTMASEILASMDGPPGKDKPLRLYGADAEEMRYLWTALIILGENNSKMKFGEDAIKLDRYGSNDFDPAQEKGTFLKISTGFNENSLYKQFKASVKVQDKITVLKKMTDDKFGQTKEREKVDARVVKANENLKSQLKDVKQQAGKVVKEEGPSPKAPKV